MNKDCQYNVIAFCYAGLIIIVILLAITNNCKSQDISKDKQLHFAAGATISGWSYCVGYNASDKRWVVPVFGLSGASLAGIGKESYDKINGGKFDVKDLGATIIGAIVSVVIIEGIRRIIKKR